MKAGGRVVLPRGVLASAGFTPGAELTVEVRDGAILLRKASTSKVDQGFGMGSRAWEGIDTDEYLRRERMSWDRKTP